MVGTKQGTNTSVKDNMEIKKAKKPSIGDKLIINMNGINMKGVVIRRKVDGLIGGFPTIEPPN